jgi:hypothetical protein
MRTRKACKMMTKKSDFAFVLVWRLSCIARRIQDCCTGDVEWKSHSRHIDSQEQSRMQSEVRQLTAEDILSEYHRKLLSPNAVRLYVAVWFRMGSRNATEIWLTDEDASCRARILLQDIPAAQSELAKGKAHGDSSGRWANAIYVCR